ncbi:MAG: metallophosphoesterase [Clostridia bacterium]|nr:metallophosphoesterase [Clostridia bacterium]
MKSETETENALDYEYKCGKLSEVVIISLRSFLSKIKKNGLKKMIETFLPGVNLDEFVLQKIRNQMQKRRAIELKKGLGRIDIQYRRNGIQIEPAGFLRTFIKCITITDAQIIRSFNNIIFQVEECYIYDDNYIISKIDEIIFELSKTGIYTPKNSEEKTLYDFAMLIIANYFQDKNDVPKWISPALKSLESSDFIEKWIEFLTEHVSEIIAQVSENIFFDFKFTFDSFWIRTFLNKKTNKGQLSELIKMFGIDIKSIIEGFAKSYVSPSFLRGARDIISDIACGLLSNTSAAKNGPLIIGGDQIPDGAFDITVSFGVNAMNSRAFRWYTKEDKQCTFEYSYDANFSESYFAPVESVGAARTFPNINLGLVSSYHVQNLTKHSVNVENLKSGIFYYHIICENDVSKTYKLRINGESSKSKFLVFADSQGMVQSDYESFESLTNKAAGNNQDADFMVHLGDFVDDGNNEDYWKWVLSGDVWKENAFLALSGNHEARRNVVAHGANVGNSVLGHFNLPVTKEQSKDLGAYYSVDYKNMTIIALNTNTGGEVGLDDKQYRWAIETAKKSKSKWKILLTHKSLYSNGPHHKDPDVKLIGKQIDDIAYYGGIDLVIGGHDHVYARTPVLAQGCVNSAQSEACILGDRKYKSYINPKGTIFVVPGTSGVKNYKQHFPAGFPSEKLLDLHLPVYSEVSVSDDGLYFDAYSFDEKTDKFTRVDSFGIIKRAENEEILSAKSVDAMIEAVPDIPWKDHEKAILEIQQKYSLMDYSEKLKLENYTKFLNLLAVNRHYKNITQSKIAVVRTLKEFLAAVEDEKIGTIITDCSEISFESAVRFARKIYIKRSLCIAGDAKLSHVRFVICEDSCVMLKGSVCVDNTRKPFSVFPAYDAFEMYDNSIFILSENASVNNGYGIGKQGYGINVKGENATVYLSTSGHNFARNGFVFSPNSTSSVKINSGKYISCSRKYSLNVNGDTRLSGGFVRSIELGEDGRLCMIGGTVGDNQRKSLTYPIKIQGKADIFSGTINSHGGVSICLEEGSGITLDKKHDNTIDIKGKVLYN